MIIAIRDVPVEEVHLLFCSELSRRALMPRRRQPRQRPRLIRVPPGAPRHQLVPSPPPVRIAAS